MYDKKIIIENSKGNIILQDVSSDNISIEQKIDASNTKALKEFIKKANNNLLADIVSQIESKNSTTVKLLYSAKKELKTRRRLRLTLTTSIVSLVIFAALIIIYFFSTHRYSSIFHDSPAWLHSMRSNAKCEIYKTNGISGTESIPWFICSGDSLKTTTKPSVEISVEKSLYYYSQLQEQDSWTGFLFSRRYTLQKYFNLLEKKNIILVIQAKNKDKLEVKLKHKFGNEVKQNIQIQKGLNGYKIPISRFSGIDKSQIELILFSHTNAAGSSLNNEFYFPFIGFE